MVIIKLLSVLVNIVTSKEDCSIKVVPNRLTRKNPPSIQIINPSCILPPKTIISLTLPTLELSNWVFNTPFEIS
jgi:hypothetical protein